MLEYDNNTPSEGCWYTWRPLSRVIRVVHLTASLTCDTCGGMADDAPVMKVPLKSILDVFGGDASRLAGLRVRSYYKPVHDHTYEAHHRLVRAAHDGQGGEIIYHHDAHELCFNVLHDGPGAIVTWELDELHVELTIEAP